MMSRPRIEGCQYGKKGQRFVLLACEVCGKERWIRADNISKRCHSCQPTGENSHNWKGGRQKDPHGYIRVKLPDDSHFLPMTYQKGYILEHRLVMAQHLGRCLIRTEVVHHINGIKDDNGIENLHLTTKECHRLGYDDAYAEGFRQGVSTRDKSLEKQIKLLQWRIKELSEALKLKLEI